MKKRLKIETIEIGGFAPMLATLRLPYGLQCRSNILKGQRRMTIEEEPKQQGQYYDEIMYESPLIFADKKDIVLLQKLILRGDEHAKAMRMPQVWANVTAPRWFWNELVTYEVGVTKGCSNSTMHQECKSLEGEELQNAKDEIKEGTLQTRTYMFSYQALRRIYFQRKDHRLLIWRDFCDWIESLPMSKELITIGIKK